MPALPATRSTMWRIALFCGASMLGVGAVYWAFSAEAPAIVSVFWVFYAPAWLVSNGLFGGIHGAPAWSMLPSIVIAVFGQNLLVWLIVRWALNRLALRRTLRALRAEEP
jgi:hypothetical protein